MPDRRRERPRNRVRICRIARRAQRIPRLDAAGLWIVRGRNVERRIREQRVTVVVVIPRADLEHDVTQVEPVSREEARLDRMHDVRVHEDLTRHVAAPVREVGVLVVAAQRKPVIAICLPVDHDPTRDPRFL